MSYSCKLISKKFFVVGFCSHWSDIEKISSVDELGQMENSLKESLNQINTHKVSTRLSYKMFT
jgi:hypothetical protein